MFSNNLVRLKFITTNSRNYRDLLKIIRALIASGLINYFYPHQPNHPRQKYIATEIVSEHASGLSH